MNFFDPPLNPVLPHDVQDAQLNRLDRILYWLEERFPRNTESMPERELLNRMDRIITLLEARESSPNTSAPHSSNGFDWVRQLELAFSMISNGSVEVSFYKTSSSTRAAVRIDLKYNVTDFDSSYNSKEPGRVAELFRQAFEEKIVQEGNHSRPRNKFGVA